MPTEPEQVRAIWADLGLPGIIDVHTHFMPKPVLDKVWRYFDAVGPLVGRPWPITYRDTEAERVNTLRRFGVRNFTSMIYPHKPQMAQWLNQWATQFAAHVPDCLHTATFFPEPDAASYVTTALEGGTKVFKAHIQVGDYDPNDPLLQPVWAILAESGTPTVIHCGSGPAPGTFTGPAPIQSLLRAHPRLPLIIAHMGMPEYSQFLDLADSYPNVHLDTTMAFTKFVDEIRFPANEHARLLDLGDRILWGSDFPNIPYRYAEAMAAVTELRGIDDTWLRGVFHHNAARLFNLD